MVLKDDFYEKQNYRLLMLFASLAILIGILYWVARVALLKYRIVIDINSFTKITIYSLVLPILMLWPNYYILKKFKPRPESQKRSLSFMQMMMFTFFFCFFFIGWGGVISLNALADKKPVQFYKVEVLEKHSGYLRFFPYYDLIVKTWTNNTGQRIIDLSQDEYDHLYVKQGDYVSIGIGKGALGLNWISSIQKAND